jgi:hypothetical protein
MERMYVVKIGECPLLVGKMSRGHSMESEKVRRVWPHPKCS